MSFSSTPLPEELHIIPWLSGATAEMNLLDAGSLSERAKVIDEMVSRIDKEDP